MLTYKDIMSRGGTSSTQFISENHSLNQADSGFVILFTSGTTGLNTEKKYTYTPIATALVPLIPREPMKLRRSLLHS